MKGYPVIVGRFALLISITGMGVGCESGDEEQHICDRLCDPYFKAEKNHAMEDCDGFDESDSSVKSKCIEHCKDAYEELASEDRSMVKDCSECVIENVSSNPEYPELLAAEIVCQDEYGDGNFDLFLEEFNGNWYCDIEYGDPSPDCGETEDCYK